MVNVWTVLWVGDAPFSYKTRPATMEVREETRLYKPRDVIRYERMVRKHLPDCRFLCLTNVDIPGIECVPIETDLVGWWPKMELFRPGLPEGRNVYFDLDTVLIGGLEDIVNYPAPFAAAKPGARVGSGGKRKWLDQEGKYRISGKYQTSVMVWDTEYGRRFWDAFKPEHVETLASDQDFLAEVFPNEKRMPQAWFSKIRAINKWRRPHAGLKVVLTMPYRNDRAAELFSWVRERWSDGGD